MQSSIALQDVSGLPFRLMLNDALQALITQNSGPNEPNPTYAFQWWADTTTGILKQRNAANNDWVEILDLATGRPVGAVAQTSPTGALLLAEGTDDQRPAVEDIPTGFAAVRGNSTSPTDRFLEFWNRVTNTWDAIASRKWVTDLIEKLFSPSVTGNAVMTGVDNKIVLSDIVSKLSLEKGDVVRVVAGAYNKLHTAESLLNSNEIVVNYEHCGSRGNGPLKLQDFTGPVTITRIVKWFSAAEGLGQDWVNVTGFRDTTSSSPFVQNSSGRQISVSAYRTAGSSLSITIEIDGMYLGSSGAGITNTHNEFIFASVGRDSSYRCTVTSGSVSSIFERR